jgi:hypothetical protein
MAQEGVQIVGYLTQPFRGVGSQSLREAFREPNAAAHFKSRTTYHTMLLSVVEDEREKFKNLLEGHDGLFNITRDAWSDIQQREVLGKSVCTGYPRE